jgi:hypothetical protein
MGPEFELYLSAVISLVVNAASSKADVSVYGTQSRAQYKYTSLMTIRRRKRVHIISHIY